MVQRKRLADTFKYKNNFFSDILIGNVFFSFLYILISRNYWTSENFRFFMDFLGCLQRDFTYHTKCLSLFYTKFLAVREQKLMHGAV